MSTEHQAEHISRLRAFKFYYDKGAAVANCELKDGLALLDNYDRLLESIRALSRYAAHHSGCAEYHGANDDCTCGLDALRDRLRKEGTLE